ncbi:MAG: DUF2550 domain-containing protein [Dermatophilaceae bacterium]
MPSALVSIEVVVGTVLTIVAVVLAVTYLRRRYISRGLILTLCGYRSTEADRWRLGLLRFGNSALEWYTLGGVSPRPRHVWQRQALLLESPLPLPPDQTLNLLPEASRVLCTEAGKDFELALQRSAYMALRSWQEAAPPGYNVNVA